MQFVFAVAFSLLGAALAAAPAFAQDKTLRIGIHTADVGTLDPHRSSATQDMALFTQMFNGLVRFPPGSADVARLEPDLAERWESSPDGLVWTFHLRRGVQFHHGFGELTADDVAHSLKRGADPARSNFASDFAEFKAIEAVDQATVRITLSKPVPSLLGLVSDYHGGLVISRKADEQLGENFKLKPVGTGVFAFESYEGKTATTLVANKAYFRGSPKIGRIAMRYIPSDQTRELALTTGELDLILGSRVGRWVDRLKSSPGIVVDVFQPGELIALYVDIKKGPLQDVRVRRALQHGLDRSSFQNFVGASVAEPSPSMVPPGYLGETRDVPAYPFDPAKAKALLAEAGFPNGLTIKSVSSSSATLLTVMQQTQAQLAKIGVTVELEVVDHATYHAQIRKDLSAITVYGAARFPVADSYLTQFYHSRAGIGLPSAVTNFSHCDVADAEIDAARSEVDRAKQLALWAEAQRKIGEAACGIPLYSLLQVFARTAKLDYGYKLEGALGLAPPITEKTTLN